MACTDRVYTFWWYKNVRYIQKKWLTKHCKLFVLTVIFSPVLVRFVSVLTNISMNNNTKKFNSTICNTNLSVCDFTSHPHSPPTKEDKFLFKTRCPVQVMSILGDYPFQMAWILGTELNPNTLQIISLEIGNLNSSFSDLNGKQK